MLSVVSKRFRAVGLDLTTKRVDDDSREPEMKKATQMRSL
ncbi:hypothetical protein HCN71_28190 [Klebsiella pneumoniae]|nr:hypothetical protein H226_2649 [Klebsiella pneumoniae UHKPC18]NMR58819.1 hypothetical protein [Klebsiella pneumoniae]QEQ95178.1 hypothetical protein [Klebsiella phage ST512-KPC3phi13.5]CCM83570.1 hypothetical protein BN426_3080 [Klebsiella pneumoniae subsp. pneumoniae ST258-K26BO]